MSRFSHESCFFKPSKRAFQSGSCSKLIFSLPTKSTLMQITSYGQVNTYTDSFLCKCLCCLSFSLWWGCTPALYYCCLPACVPLKSMRTHLPTWRLLLLISLYITLSTCYYKITSILPVWGGHLGFLKYSKKLCDARGLSVGSGRGKSANIRICAIQPGSLASAVLLLLSCASMWEEPHKTIAISQMQDVLSGFYASLLILE